MEIVAKDGRGVETNSCFIPCDLTEQLSLEKYIRMQQQNRYSQSTELLLQLKST